VRRLQKLYINIIRNATCEERPHGFQIGFLECGLLPEQEMPESAPLGSNIPRLSHAKIPGHIAMYFIPNENGSVEEGERIYNWAAHIPLAEEDLEEFMVDRSGRFHDGSRSPSPKTFHIRKSKPVRSERAFRRNSAAPARPTRSDKARRRP
jgi:hypothetical protein